MSATNNNGGDGVGAWAKVVTGLRLMSSAAQHTANAAAADPTAFHALVETLQRCLCWQPQPQQQHQHQQQQQGFNEGTEGVDFPDVRLEAVRALGSVVVACERPSEQEAFSSCLPHLLQAIQGEPRPPFGGCFVRRRRCRSRRRRRRP